MPLIGNLGQEPQVTVLENGKKVARVSLATNENLKTAKGRNRPIPAGTNLFHGEKLLPLLKSMYLQENCRTEETLSRSYEDKEGVKRHITEVIISEILFLGGNPSNQ